VLLVKGRASYLVTVIAPHSSVVGEAKRKRWCSDCCQY